MADVSFDVLLTPEEIEQVKGIAQVTGVSEQRVIESLIDKFLRPTASVGYTLPPNGALFRAKKGGER